MQIRMDWRSVNFDWNRARAFLVTAEEGSFSAAAHALGMSQPTLGRQVSALEEELGVALFERLGKGLELTPSGLDLLEHVRAMGSAATNLSLSASGKSSSLEGNVCISATEYTAVVTLPPLLYKLHQLHPGIQVELIASNSASDLKRREADIAVRGFRPTQPDLIARKLGEVHWYLYASSDYLKSLKCHGQPGDLNQADYIGISDLNRMIALFEARGIHVKAENFSAITDNIMVQWGMLKQGLGIGVQPERLAQTEPNVERVLPAQEPLIEDIWLVVHRELRTNRRIRAVFDFLVAELTPLLNQHNG